jgi:hypothetical protein
LVRHRTLTACIVGSSPASVTILLGYNSVVECLTVNQDVAGSIPATSANAEMVELGYTPDLGSGALSGMGVRVSLSAPSLQRGRYSVRFHKPDLAGSTPASVTNFIMSSRSKRWYHLGVKFPPLGSILLQSCGEAALTHPTFYRGRAGSNPVRTISHWSRGYDP